METISLSHFYLNQKFFIRNIIEEIIKDNIDLEKIEKIFIERHNYVIKTINDDSLINDLYNDLLNDKGANIIDLTQEVTPLIQKYLTKWTNIIHKIEEILNDSSSDKIPLDNLDKKYAIIKLLM